MIRSGFLDGESRRDLIDLARDGAANLQQPEQRTREPSRRHIDPVEELVGGGGIGDDVGNRVPRGNATRDSIAEDNRREWLGR